MVYGHDLSKKGKLPVTRIEYPYVQVTQESKNRWLVILHTAHQYYRWDDSKPMNGDYRYARTKAGAEAKGKKMLAKWRKKYGNFSDPYRIR